MSLGVGNALETNCFGMRELCGRVADSRRRGFDRNRGDVGSSP
jgi:hypothetical protein